MSDGVVITANPREFVYYFHRYPDYYRAVEMSGGLHETGLISDAQDFHQIVMNRRNVYFIGSEWNFFNDAFMNADMRNTVEYAMAPADHGGDRRILASTGIEMKVFIVSSYLKSMGGAGKERRRFVPGAQGPLPRRSGRPAGGSRAGSGPRDRHARL